MMADTDIMETRISGSKIPGNLYFLYVPLCVSLEADRKLKLQVNNMALT